jgi:hypothetical protein
MNAIPSAAAGREIDTEVGQETEDCLVEVGTVSERTKGEPWGPFPDGGSLEYIP